MRSILSLDQLGDPQKIEFLFNGVQPFINLKWFFCLFKNGRLGVQEVLECAVLIWLWTLILLAGTGRVLHNMLQCLLHYSLVSQKLHEELIH